MIIKLKAVMKLTALSRPTVYRLIALGQFPKQVSLGERSVGWVEEEVMAWISKKIEMRNPLENKI